MGCILETLIRMAHFLRLIFVINILGLLSGRGILLQAYKQLIHLPDKEAQYSPKTGRKYPTWYRMDVLRIRPCLNRKLWGYEHGKAGDIQQNPGEALQRCQVNG
jgi:hypothetical protein